MNNPGPQAQHPDSSPDGSDIPGRIEFGSICADYGCNKVHPAENHDSYVARYSHSEGCPACADHDVDFGLTRFKEYDTGWHRGEAAVCGDYRCRKLNQHYYNVSNQYRVLIDGEWVYVR